MKHKLFALLLTTLSLLLGGCQYSHEVTEMAYTVALGIDKGDEGLRVSIQFARPLSIAGEGGGSGSSSGAASGGGEGGENTAAKNKNTTMLTIDAEDVYTALSIAENSLSKQINLSHTKLLLFSAELAKEGLTDYVTLFMKDSQFSPNTYVAVSLCSADEYMRTVNPSLEVNPAKYYTLIFSKNNSDYMPATSLRDLYFSISALGREAVLPAANLSRGEDSRTVRMEAARGDYEAGALSKSSENETDVSGMAVLPRRTVIPGTLFSRRHGVSYVDRKTKTDLSDDAFSNRRGKIYYPAPDANQTPTPRGGFGGGRTPSFGARAAYSRNRGMSSPGYS